jgi:MYXO-CTERM domain-containing protein
MTVARAQVLSMFAASLAAWAFGASARAQTSGVNATHDPSRIVESNGKFFFCSTGGSCASSIDGLAWTSTGLRLAVPSWSTTYTPGGNQGIWAPDIVYAQSKYYIYYSFCGVPAANAPCVIGLYTTPTLDSTASGYKLTDVGMVVNNPTNDSTYQFSTIDPGPIIDPAGNLWSSWGSGYGKDQTLTQLWLTRLDTTGLPLTSDTAYKPPTVLGHALETGRREGSYVHARNGYYYLFWNEGSCCDGTSSTYTIWVARSQGTISGPYSGNKVFYAGSGNIHGPGHMGIYSACGVERFTYHYYPTATSILGENDLTWTSDDWPVAGPTSTTPLKPCGNTGQGGNAGSAGGGGSAGQTGQGGNAGQRGDVGAGGTGAAGKGGATGGNPGTGGGPSGSGVAGGSGEGGAPSGGGQGGTTATGAGGTTATGQGGTGGGTTATSNGDGSGCACAAAGAHTDDPSALVALGLFAGLALGARRRRNRAI